MYNNASYLESFLFCVGEYLKAFPVFGRGINNIIDNTRKWDMSLTEVRLAFGFTDYQSLLDEGTKLGFYKKIGRDYYPNSCKTDLDVLIFLFG